MSNLHHKQGLSFLLSAMEDLTMAIAKCLTNEERNAAMKRWKTSCGVTDPSLQNTMDYIQRRRGTLEDCIEKDMETLEERMEEEAEELEQSRKRHLSITESMMRKQQNKRAKY